MISPEEAWNLIVEMSRPLPMASLDLSDALDHVLVNPVIADRDMPPADRAVRDGYAVRSADVDTVPTTLRVRGEVAAGSDAAPAIGPGECVRILTGANLPPDADAVIMVEDTQRDPGSSDREELVRFLKPVERGSHISSRGETAREGDELVPAGTRLGAMHIGACAAAGQSSVEVYRRPTVSVLVTGDELRDMDQDVMPHQIRNSNGPMLAAGLSLQGCGVVSNEFVSDDAGLIAGRLRAALERSDVVVITGGASVGKYDLVAGAIGSAGGTIHFHGVAMTPGKPTLFATTSGGGYVFGLPGNPLSAMTGFHEFVVPLMRRLAGRTVKECKPSLSVRLTEEVDCRQDRQRYVLGRLCHSEDGMAVEIVGGRGAADLVAGAKADGVVIVPPGSGKLKAGSACRFRMWKAMM